MQNFLNQVYYNNTVREYLIVLSIVLVSIFVLAIIKRIVINRLKRIVARTEGKIDDFVVSRIDRFALPIVQFAIIYWSLHLLDLSIQAEHIIEVTTSIIITYFVVRLLSSVIMLLLQLRIRKKERGEQKIKQLGGLMLVINIFIWIMGIVFLLDNMGKDVTTIITGLGIGGIAIALAAQNILGDLFNYFVIYFDRPFEVGDFIVVDDKMGTVEYLGIKTTRIRSLSGEQIIIGNSNLTGSRIHNHKRMLNRRVVFSLNIDYRTPVEKLKLLPELLKSIVEQQVMVTFDRAHFAAYGDWSLKFEVVYFFLDSDFNKFMDTHQKINFMILEELKKNEIYFVTGGHMQLAPQAQPSPSLPMPLPPAEEEERKK
jgi:small-conductance mechanosensitive channel